MLAVGLAAFAGSALADSFVAPLIQATATDGQNPWWWTAQSSAVGLGGAVLVIASSHRWLLAGAEWSPLRAPPPRAAVLALASTLLGGFDWVLYLISAAWSATAIAAVMFAQWSVLIVVYFAAVDRFWPTPGRPRRRMHARAGAAMAMAPVGVAMVMASQIARDEPLLPGSLGGKEAAGVLLGLLSAACAAVTVGGTIVYGEKTAAHHGQGPQAALWHTMVGSVCRDSIRVLILLGVALSGAGGGPAPAWTGPALVAAASMCAGLLLRVGNAVPSVPATANMICLSTPALAVLWLAVDGIAIPRLGTYLAGAAVIVASLATAQWPARGPSDDRGG